MTSEGKDAKETIDNNWLTMDESELGTYNVNKQDNDSLDKFITMSIPALNKFHSGFMAEPGDIKVCLSIQIEKDYELVIHICDLDDNGYLRERITVRGPQATAILKAFVTDYPDSVLTTSQFKTLYLFTQSDNHKKSQNLEGPMNFKTFRRILKQNINHSKHAIVAVQK